MFSTSAGSLREHLQELFLGEDGDAELQRLIVLVARIVPGHHVVGLGAHARGSAAAERANQLLRFAPRHRFESTGEDEDQAGEVRRTGRLGLDQKPEEEELDEDDVDPMVLAKRKAPTPDELDRMRRRWAKAHADGAEEAQDDEAERAKDKLKDLFKF